MYEAIYGKDHSPEAAFGKASNLSSTDADGFCIDGPRFLSFVKLAKSRENDLVVAPSCGRKSSSFRIPETEKSPVLKATENSDLRDSDIHPISYNPWSMIQRTNND